MFCVHIWPDISFCFDVVFWRWSFAVERLAPVFLMSFQCLLLALIVCSFNLAQHLSHYVHAYTYKHTSISTSEFVAEIVMRRDHRATIDRSIGWSSPCDRSCSWRAINRFEPHQTNRGRRQRQRQRQQQKYANNNIAAKRNETLKIGLDLSNCQSHNLLSFWSRKPCFWLLILNMNEYDLNWSPIIKIIK